MKHLQSTLRFLLKRKLLTLTAIILLGLALTPIIILTRTYGIVHPDAWPTPTPGRPQLESQTESFTCGVHAVSTIYKAYGLDPEAERIRWRLGADTKAVFWLPDSRGTLHPDVHMVLTQDHFDVQSLDPASDHAWDTLTTHLDTGHMAILLITTPDTGALHWVVATRHVKNQIEVYDSLHAEPYSKNSAFLADHTVSIMLINPSNPRAKMASSITAHKQGTGDAAKAVNRIKELGP